MKERRPARASWARVLGAVLVLLSFFGFVLLLPFAPFAERVSAAGAEKARTQLATPDLACVGCHRAIYESYEATSKAKGSGLALDAFDPGSFRHKPSGIDYRVFLRDGTAWMSSQRGEHDQGGSLEGERKLE